MRAKSKALSLALAFSRSQQHSQASLQSLVVVIGDLTLLSLYFDMSALVGWLGGEESTG